MRMNWLSFIDKSAFEITKGGVATTGAMESGLIAKMLQELRSCSGGGNDTGIGLVAMTGMGDLIQTASKEKSTTTAPTEKESGLLLKVYPTPFQETSK